MTTAAPLPPHDAPNTRLIRFGTVESAELLADVKENAGSLRSSLETAKRDYQHAQARHRAFDQCFDIIRAQTAAPAGGQEEKNEVRTQFAECVRQIHLLNRRQCLDATADAAAVRAAVTTMRDPARAAVEKLRKITANFQRRSHQLDAELKEVLDVNREERSAPVRAEIERITNLYQSLVNETVAPFASSEQEKIKAAAAADLCTSEAEIEEFVTVAVARGIPKAGEHRDDVSFNAGLPESSPDSSPRSLQNAENQLRRGIVEATPTVDQVDSERDSIQKLDTTATEFLNSSRMMRDIALNTL